VARFALEGCSKASKDLKRALWGLLGGGVGCALWCGLGWVGQGKVWCCVVEE
jgi:hypothetical protein